MPPPMTTTSTSAFAMSGGNVGDVEVADHSDALLSM
jgi:hypothetical protein